ITTAKLYVGIPFFFTITQSPKSLDSNEMFPRTMSLNVYVLFSGTRIRILGLRPFFSKAAICSSVRLRCAPEYLGTCPFARCSSRSVSSSSSVIYIYKLHLFQAIHRHIFDKYPIVLIVDMGHSLPLYQRLHPTQFLTILS